MLIVKVQVNNDPLDEILIHRVKGHPGEICEYEIIGHEKLGRIRHAYNDGYAVLLMKALEVLHAAGKDSFCSDIDLWNSIAACSA